MGIILYAEDEFKAFKIIQSKNAEEYKLMEEVTDKQSEKSPIKDETGNAPAFKPSISIRRKQMRRLAVQVDEEKADSFDEYVQFVSTCFGYEVSAGEVMNEILKAHFARDNGFKGWRAGRNKSASSAI